MKRLKNFFLAALSLSLLLSGCGKTGHPATEPVSGPAGNATPESPGAASSETPPGPGMVKSRLTNEWTDKENAKTRPIAVMVPNSKTASHYGLSNASVLYECNVEGSMTRLKIGRASCRDRVFILV